MRPKVVTLCGSTRFYKEFQKAYYELTMQGYIVLSVGFYPHASEEAHGEKISITEKQKLELDELHKRKIDISDIIFVINVNNYIGESTQSEIQHALKQGVTVRFLEEMVDCNSCRGRGEVTGPGGGGMELIDCPKCLGEKLIKRVSYKII